MTSFVGAESVSTDAATVPWFLKLSVWLPPSCAKVHSESAVRSLQRSTSGSDVLNSPNALPHTAPSVQPNGMFARPTCIALMKIAFEVTGHLYSRREGDDENHLDV